MRPRTREEMDKIVRGLVYDCLSFAAVAELAQTDVARLLGATRLTVHKWQRHLDEGGGKSTLPVTGATAATTFMNLMIARRMLEVAIGSGELPKKTRNRTRQWVDTILADEAE